MLLACYTKIKDDSKISSILSAFLSAAPPPAHLTSKMKAEKVAPAASQSDGNAAVTSSDGKIFDAKQVIITLSNAGYIGKSNLPYLSNSIQHSPRICFVCTEQALLVALKYHDHLSYIDLQVITLNLLPYRNVLSLDGAFMTFLVIKDPYTDP